LKITNQIDNLRVKSITQVEKAFELFLPRLRPSS